MARLIESIQGQAQPWERLMHQYRHGRLPHALAFTGPPGIGKRQVAWALAQAVLCERVDMPCGECGSCRRVEKRQSESVLAIEPQGSQIKLEAARQIIEFLSLRRLASARVIIVNEAQLLNPQAANALLKMVEEPPAGTYFILIVPEISQLLPTLRSRSQVLRFAPLAEMQLAGGREDLKPWVLRSARGSFERMAAFEDEDVDRLRRLSFSFLRASLEGQRSGLEQVLNEAGGRETSLQTVRFLQQALRDWVLLGTGEEIHADLAPELRAYSRLSSRARVELWREAHRMESDLTGNVDRLLLFTNFFYRARREMG